MADDSTLTPERLSELLTRLDDVMSDAARLRKEITRQLNDQQRRDQQKVTRTRSRRAKPSTSKRR
jgi:hypothetical protein